MVTSFFPTWSVIYTKSEEAKNLEQPFRNIGWVSQVVGIVDVKVTAGLVSR